jgi:iron complex outermembrane receptor protein
MTRTGAFTQPYIRGVGKRSTLGIENSVATYVDGVYLASPISALLDLRGIERVEILNGPQGTLFGRNATGGVIQVITREPMSHPSGEFELGGGEYGFLRGDTYVTGGSDRLAADLSLSLSRNGGYGRNIFTGKTDQGEVRHSLVGRTKWVWRPSSSLKVTLAGDYQDIDQDFSYRPVPGFVPIGEPQSHGFRNGDQDASSRYKFHYGGASLKVEAEVGGLDFMGLTARRRMHADYGADLDLGPEPLLSTTPTAWQDQFSQEFQLRGALSKVQWLAGLYFIHIKERYDPSDLIYGGSYSQQIGGRILQSLWATGNATSYAAYGQVKFPVMEATALTAGLRYTKERRSVRATGERRFDNPPFVRPFPGLPLPTEDPLRESVSAGELTGRVSLERHFTDAVMAYVSARRGFQSGGWNLQTPQTPPFRPETINDLEAGLKYASSSQLVSADINFSFSRYSDLQVTAVTPIGLVTTNATSATIRGAEIQLLVRPDSKSDITVGMQLLDARFDRFPNAACVDFSRNAPMPYAPITCDASHNRLPFAPRFKFDLGGDRRFGLGRLGAMILSGNLAYNSGYFSEPDNVLRQDAFATIDASAEWLPNWRGPSVQLWVLNLTDAHYFNSLTTFATVGALQVPAAPRRFGATLKYAF